jgi:hypothetical protein
MLPLSSRAEEICTLIFFCITALIDSGFETISVSFFLSLELHAIRKKITRNGRKQVELL